MKPFTYSILALSAMLAHAGTLEAQSAPETQLAEAAYVAPAPPQIVVHPRAATPRRAWAPQDPADSLYRAAREALNRDDYTRAADLFDQIIRRHPDSVYVPDAYYWRAFALYRQGDADALRTALGLLEQRQARHPDAERGQDAEALATRIQGALARLGDAGAAESLTKAAAEAAAPETICADSDDDVRTAALNALLHMDAGRAVPILKSVLARRDPCSAPMRRKAVFLISQQVTPETEDILLDLARTDSDREVREQAVFWLSQVNSEKAVDALVQVLRESDDPGMQEKAIFALSQHPSTRASQTLREYAVRTDAPDRLREQAIFWIGQDASAENARFLRELYSRLDAKKLKEKVIFSLSQMGGFGNERWLLEAALDSSVDIGLRKHALFWAGQAGAPIGELTDLYDRMQERELREHLIFVYSQRRDRAAVDKLIDIARNERNPDLRKKAIFWLGQTNDPRAAETLLELINHE